MLKFLYRNTVDWNSKVLKNLTQSFGQNVKIRHVHVPSTKCITKAGVSVYIHWPYCQRKCTYCNFNKYVVSFMDHPRLVGCLLKEWKTLSTEVGAVNSVYFGGGTPSLMRPQDVGEIIRYLQTLSAAMPIVNHVIFNSLLDLYINKYLF